MTCEHGRRRYRCVLCDGVGICEHKRRRRRCRVCDFGGYLHHRVGNRVRAALKRGIKDKTTFEYLGCTAHELKKYIEDKFTEGMTWENTHVDHIVPVCFENPSTEEKIARLHYTNLQPMFAVDNLRKGNRYVSPKGDGVPF